MQVTVYPDELRLHEVLRLLSITDRPIDEVQQSSLISLDQLLERPLLAAEKRSNNRRVVQRAQPFSDSRSRQRYRSLDCDVSHGLTPVIAQEMPASDGTEFVSCTSTGFRGPRKARAVPYVPNVDHCGLNRYKSIR